MSLQNTIDQAWENRTELSAASAPAEVRDAVNHIIDQLDTGKVRVAEKIDGAWVTHQWVKKAVLLSFRLHDNQPVHAGALTFFDKVQTKFSHMDADALRASGVRVVPPAVARRRRPRRHRAAQGRPGAGRRRTGGRPAPAW